MAYAVAADVQARLSGRDISTTSKPSTAQVDAWIAETDAELNGELRAAKFTVPVTGADPLAIVKSKVVSRVGARVLGAYAAGTNFDEDDLASTLNAEWNEFIAAIRTNPGRIGELIGQSISGTRNRGSMRSHVTDNSKGLDTDDLAPVFTTRDEN